MVFNLDELDYFDNLENGSPSNTLFTYHVTSYDDSIHLEPYTPHYKKLNKGELVSPVLRMKGMKNNIMADVQ